MSPGLPARVTVVCALVAAAAPARAQDRREVAVIALTDDPGAKQLSQAIYTALLGHWALQPTARRELDAALAGEFLDEDRELLREANQQRATAGDALAQFTYDQARDAAQRGLAALTGATPTRAAPLAADLAFVLGEALLDLHAVNDSYQMFRFVHALDPMRRVDPAAIDPDKLGAYDKAQTLRAAHYKLDVQGSGRVWIDGVDAGAAPGTFDVEAGYHLVQLVGPERVTAGKLVVVKHDDAVAIDDRPASEQLRLQRARLALHDAPAEAVSRAGPMKQLAQLLGVHDAVLIWKANDKLWVQTWRDREPGFSALREHGNESPGDVLAPLAPPKPPEPPHVVEAPRPLPPVTHVEDEPAWYRKRWVQASVAGGVIAAVVGAIVWSRHTTYISIMPGTSYVPQ